MQKKRGALDLSMNTIVVIVIGITILTLGLRWVFGVFGDIEESRRGVSEGMRQQIRETFGETDEAINMIPKTVTLEQGEKFDVGLGIRNTLKEQHPFVYDIIIQDIPENADKNVVKNWFVSGAGTPINLDSGELQADIISIDVPKQNAPLGVYRISVTLKCTDGCGIDEYVPFVLRVQ
ncbi:MAG: hypothetical protein AABW87_00570 [Nanoarchaeota archaeon]